MITNLPNEKIFDKETVVKRLLNMGKSSVVVLLPQEWLREMGLTTDDYIKIEYNSENNSIKIEKVE